MKWEYRQLDISSLSDLEIGNWLVRYGIDGWELVAIYRNVAYFKRPLG